MNSKELSFLSTIYSDIVNIKVRGAVLNGNVISEDTYMVLKRLINSSVSNGILSQREYASLYTKYWNGFTESEIARMEKVQNSFIAYRFKTALRKLNFELSKKLGIYPEGSIEYLDLSKRAYNALKFNGINKYTDLSYMSEKDIYSLKNVGTIVGNELVALVKELKGNEEGK